MKNIFKNIIGLIVIIVTLSVSTFANQNTKGHGNPIQRPVQYTQMSYNTIKANPCIERWYQKYYPIKGIHFRQYGADTYILISGGKELTGGYALMLNDVRHISRGTVYVTASEKHSSGNRIVTQTSTYPHLLIKTDDPCIIRVEGVINEPRSGE